MREQIDEDRQLRRRLELRAAGARGDLVAVRACICELLDIGPFAQYGHIEYSDARAYADQAGQVVSAIGALIGSEWAADAIILAREAMRLLAEAVESVDDSDGGLGQVGAAYLMERLAKAGGDVDAVLRDAVSLRRDHVGARRSLLSYQQFRAAARAADCWPAERAGALTLLREGAGRRHGGWCGGSHTPQLTHQALGGFNPRCPGRPPGPPPPRTRGTAGPPRWGCRGWRSR